jgi:hypothetical protein
VHERLARVNPTTAFLGALAVVLLGLFAPGIIGGAVLGALAAGLAYLTWQTWSVQPPALRVVRLVLLSGLIAAVLAKIV